MKDLAQLLATDEGEEQALKRLQIIDMARGILNSIAIDSEGEDYGFQQFSVTGIKEVIDATCNMLSALTEIPQTKLFGRSPAGMSATGESDLENYYNFIGKIQKLMLKHNLMRIIDIICLAARKNGEIEEIPKIKLTFDPLWSLSEQEQASVTVAARKESRRVMIEALGYKSSSIEEIRTENYRLIINTVPAMVLPHAPGTALKIDLASVPGIGGRDVLWARGLPGLLAPESSGALIAQVITQWIKEK